MLLAQKRDALARCEEMEQLLNTRLREKDRNYNSVADRSEPRNDFWYKGQIVAIAKQHDYFADAYSIADIAVYPWVARHEWHRVDLAEFPKVKRWYDAIGARPAVQRGMAVPQT